jgi:hypothetical protein
MYRSRSRIGGHIDFPRSMLQTIHAAAVRGRSATAGNIASSGQPYTRLVRQVASSPSNSLSAALMTCWMLLYATGGVTLRRKPKIGILRPLANSGEVGTGFWPNKKLITGSFRPDSKRFRTRADAHASPLQLLGCSFSLLFESTNGRKPDSPTNLQPVRRRVRPRLHDLRESFSGPKPAAPFRNAGRDHRRKSRR